MTISSTNGQSLTIDSEEGYQPPTMHLAPSYEYISAESLDDLAVSIAKLLHSVIFQSRPLTTIELIEKGNTISLELQLQV
jgi:hypothetical protein